MSETVVLGAGAAGLGAARALKRARQPFEILEASATVGGLAQTDDIDGFSFERTGHVLHFGRPQLERLFRRLVPVDRIERRAAILVEDAEIPYPLQYNLWALRSRRQIREALADLRGAAVDGVHAAESFADVLVATCGPTLMSTFLRPYNEKLWGRPLEELPPDCAGRYLPRVDLDLAERGARHRIDYRGYNGSFLFPTSGRLGELMDALAAPLGDAIRSCCSVTAVDLERRELQTAGGDTIRYERLISTIPLARFVEMAGLGPRELELFAATEIVNVRVGVRGRTRTPYHWVYVADGEQPFHRIGFPTNVSPRTCPRGCTSLSVEYTVPLRRRRLSGPTIAASVLNYLTRLGLLEVDECLTVSELVISPAYVIKRAPGRREFAELARTLEEHGVCLAGRFGVWDYLSIEEAYTSGSYAANTESEAA